MFFGALGQFAIGEIPQADAAPSSDNNKHAMWGALGQFAIGQTDEGVGGTEYTVDLTVYVDISASVINQVGKTISSQINLTGTFLKIITKNINTFIYNSVLIMKSVFKTILLNVNFSITISTPKTILQNILLSVTLSVPIAKQVGKNILASVYASHSILKTIGKYIVSSFFVFVSIAKTRQGFGVLFRPKRNGKSRSFWKGRS